MSSFARSTPRLFSGRKSIPRVRTTRRLRVLTQREARILAALGDTVFPAESSGMPSTREAQVVEYVDDLLVHLPLKERALIRGLLALLEVQSLVFNGSRPALFSNASLEDRERNLRGWERSRIFERRVVFMAIRTLLLWAYVDSQEAERGMGFVAGTHATDRRNLARTRARQALSHLARDTAPPDPSETDTETKTDAVVGRSGWSTPAPQAKSQDTAEKHA